MTLAQGDDGGVDQRQDFVTGFTIGAPPGLGGGNKGGAVVRASCR